MDTQYESERPHNNRVLSSEINDERFSLIINAVKDYAIFILDPEGRILTWNKGAERIKGYKASEVIGKHFSIFYSLNEVKKNHPQKELESALKNGKYEEEGWRVRKNGTTFWAAITINPLKDEQGRHIGFVKITRDLTERKEAEEKLRLSEERYRRMFDGIKDFALITLDDKGHVTSWNEGARRISGYEENEIMGHYFATFYPEQDIQMGKCEYELQEAALTGKFEDEGWRIRKDGTRYWASVLISSIRNSHGKVIGFTKVIRDITERKRASDLLKMAYTNLEKRVEERTNELMKINKQLQEAIQARDEFLSIASHELRTPLTPLKLQIQSLRLHLKRGNMRELSSEKLEKVAETCDKAISRLVNLIESLLDVSRINTGRIILHPETFDLTEVMQEILLRYKPEIDNSETEIILNDSGPVIGNFDKLRIEQVLINLLTNALKYGNKNPVYIDIRGMNGFAEIIFEDHGVGIKDSDKERIFERFERVETMTSIGGLGLGLYITKQIIEAHRGQIEVISSPGKGSSFIINLPLNLTTQ